MPADAPLVLFRERLRAASAPAEVLGLLDEMEADGALTDKERYVRLVMVATEAPVLDDAVLERLAASGMLLPASQNPALTHQGRTWMVRTAIEALGRTGEDASVDTTAASAIILEGARGNAMWIAESLFALLRDGRAADLSVDGRATVIGTLAALETLKPAEYVELLQLLKAEPRAIQINLLRFFVVDHMTGEIPVEAWRAYLTDNPARELIAKSYPGLVARIAAAAPANRFREEFLALTRDNPTAAAQMVANDMERVHRAITRDELVDLLYGSAEASLRAELIEMVERFGPPADDLPAPESPVVDVPDTNTAPDRALGVGR